MPRHPRSTPGGYVYHVLNRGVARMTLFHKDADYEAFLRVLEETFAVHPTRLLAFCLMPTHWHFDAWPQHDGELTAFFQWLSHTHTMRWHTHYHTLGSGHLYQGRFKSFPVEEDDYLLTVLRYAERNPLRAGLVERAEDWPWSSLGLLTKSPERAGQLLSPWPVARPRNWTAFVNRPQTEAELEAVRRCVTRGSPYGSEGWSTSMAERLDLGHTLRPRGRPRKNKADT